MKAKTYFMISAAFCLSIAAAGLGQQREPPKSPTARFGDPTSTARIYQDYIYGVIKNVNTQELVLDKTVYGDDQVVKLEKKTRYVHDGKPSTFSHLKPGDQVYVDTKKEKKTGQLTARKVVTGMVTTGLQ